MRRWFLAPVVALLVSPGAALADTGGAAAPDPTPVFPTPKPPVPRLAAKEFSITPGTIVPGGAPVQIAYRIDGRARRVRVRVDIVRVGSHAAALRRRLGWKTTGLRRVYLWSLPAGALATGDYVARLHAVDDAGNTLRRTATASGRLPVHVEVAVPPAPATGPGVFPLGGSSWSFGGDDARFGAARHGHVHQGQDIMAPEGTPILTPRAGTVFWRAVQKGGAGHYLVVRGDDGRDYVFMHLVAGSELVAKGDPVAMGQQIGQVGTTGDTSGAHLHFEIWPGGWYAKDSAPIDPRPDLDAWAAQAASGAAPA